MRGGGRGGGWVGCGPGLSEGGMGKSGYILVQILEQSKLLKND